MPTLRSPAGVALALALAATGPAAADSFRVMMGGAQLGTLEAAPTSLRLRLAGTPLGAFDGTFEAKVSRGRTEAGGEAMAYGSFASRKNRRIDILSARGRVVQVAVSPPGDATAVSDPAAVPAGVLDPVHAFARVSRTRSAACPGAMRMYDGRRLTALVPGEAEATGTARICHATYQVAQGPGHAGPLALRSAKVVLVYPPEGGPLQEMRVSAGPFTLAIQR